MTLEDFIEQEELNWLVKNARIQKDREEKAIQPMESCVERAPGD